ncbi:hypothetical protein [Paenibacillus cremeus]|uniref:hypothetical protein n=1 Tax=Paenibacillus cremeus TaxID=2163881 RepID=UPI001646F268|nr:hypothetical protein [Paenibacillus cremeus]
MAKVRKVNNQKFNNGKTKVHSEQKASAKIGQGGNAFAINASEVAVIRPQN